jgi:uncharacterized membrane protein YbhN (UPF0104 family)
MSAPPLDTPPRPEPLAYAESERRRPAGSLLLTILKWALCLLIVVYVARALARHINAIDWSTVHFHAGFALLGAACVALVTATQVVAYRLLLGAYGLSVRWRHAATLSWLPALGKYVPGKVVAISSTVYLLRRFKIPAAVALSVALMGDALAVLTGLIVGAPMLRSPEVRARLPGGWVWSLTVILIGVTCLYPPVFTRLVNVALRKLKRQPLSHVPQLRYYLLPVIAAFAQWICWGLAVWCVTRSVADVAIARVIDFTFMTALANTIGYLALFAPGGIGVREALLLLPLTQTPGVGDKAAVVVLAVRLIQTIVEVLLAALGLTVLKTVADPEHEG